MSAIKSRGMKIYNNFEGYNFLYICGDIHGEFKTLLYQIKNKGIVNAVILVAGDCGVGFEKATYYDQLYKYLERTLSKYNCLLILLRGNHDAPEYFQNKLINFPRMKTLPDYSIIQFKNRNILRVGGAISIDWSERLQAIWKAELKGRTVPKCYWDNEIPIFDEAIFAQLKSNSILIDTIVTHSAPSFCKPVNKSDIEHWFRVDKDLSEAIKQERKTMDAIYDHLKADKHPLSNWYYGIV